MWVCSNDKVVGWQKAVPIGAHVSKYLPVLLSTYRSFYHTAVTNMIANTGCQHRLSSKPATVAKTRFCFQVSTASKVAKNERLYSYMCQA